MGDTNKKVKTNKKTKLIIKVILMSFFVLFFLAGIFFIYVGYMPKKENVETYIYNEDEDISYKVYLKENDFYAEKYLDMDKQYPSNLIDYIDIDFSYLFNGSDIVNLDYSYDINASIIGDYESTKTNKSEIWHKDYKLADPVNKKLTSTNYSIKNNVKIDYGYYNDEVLEFRNKNKLAIEAYLKVLLTINYSGTKKDSKIEFKDKKEMEINIPLTNSTFKIETNFEKHKSNTLTETIENNKNYYYIIFGGTLVLINLWLAFEFYFVILRKEKTEFTKNLEKILKDYSEIIVEVSTPLEYDKSINVLDIKTFEDMVDIEEEIKSPILLYEIKKKHEAWFIIIKDEYMYRYILK